MTFYLEQTGMSAVFQTCLYCSMIKAQIWRRKISTCCPKNEGGLEISSNL